jgi:hypothetical protein
MSWPHAMLILPGLIHFILIHFVYIFLIIYLIEIVQKWIKIKTECIFFVASHLRKNVDRKHIFCMKMCLGQRFYMLLRLTMMHSIHKLGYKNLQMLLWASLTNVMNHQITSYMTTLLQAKFAQLKCNLHIM